MEGDHSARRFISSVEVVGSAGNAIRVEIHVDDRAIAEKAVDLSNATTGDIRSAKRRASEIGNDLATVAVTEVLESLGAFGEENAVSGTVHTSHQLDTPLIDLDRKQSMTEMAHRGEN